MPEAPRIWVPAELLAPGTRALLYGSVAGGAVDYAAPEAGAAASAITTGEGFGRAGGDVDSGPLERGTLLEPAASVCLRATPRVYGRFRFGVKTIERDTGEALASGHGEVECFVSATPEPPHVMTCVAALAGGALVFEVFGQRTSG